MATASLTTTGLSREAARFQVHSAMAFLTLSFVIAAGLRKVLLRLGVLFAGLGALWLVARRGCWCWESGAGPTGGRARKETVKEQKSGNA